MRMDSMSMRTFKMSLEIYNSLIIRFNGKLH